MPFGAHETMEVHEVLNEKLTAIQHFSLYAQMARDQQLREMIDRHLDTAIRGYDQLVAYTHDYSAAPHGHQPPSYGMIEEVQPGDIQYGLRRPGPVTPGLQGTLNEQQILRAMLSCHKNSAKLNMHASLECADPNVRQMLLSDANICNELAYEVFMVMNEQGQYQVPVMNDHTAKTFLHSYQPAGGELQNAPMPYGFM